MSCRLCGGGDFLNLIDKNIVSDKGGAAFFSRIPPSEIVLMNTFCEINLGSETDLQA